MTCQSVVFVSPHHNCPFSKGCRIWSLGKRMRLYLLCRLWIWWIRLLLRVLYKVRTYGLFSVSYVFYCYCYCCHYCFDYCLSLIVWVKIDVIEQCLVISALENYDSSRLINLIITTKPSFFVINNSSCYKK